MSLEQGINHIYLLFYYSFAVGMILFLYNWQKKKKKTNECFYNLNLLDTLHLLGHCSLILCFYFSINAFFLYPHSLITHYLMSPTIKKLLIIMKFFTWMESTKKES